MLDSTATNQLISHFYGMAMHGLVTHTNNENFRPNFQISRWPSLGYGSTLSLIRV